MKNSSQWARASLRIYSETCTVDEISDLLATRPTRSHSIGDPVSLRRDSSPKHEDNLWLLESGLSSSASLRDHIMSVITFIKNHRSEFSQLETTCTIDVLCGYSLAEDLGCIELPHQLLNELSLQPIDLIINVYGETDDEGG